MLSVCVCVLAKDSPQSGIFIEKCVPYVVRLKTKMAAASFSPRYRMSAAVFDLWVVIWSLNGENPDPEMGGKNNHEQKFWGNLLSPSTD